VAARAVDGPVVGTLQSSLTQRKTYIVASLVGIEVPGTGTVATLACNRIEYFFLFVSGNDRSMTTHAYPVSKKSFCRTDSIYLGNLNGARRAHQVE